jgi:hypothetical protein
MTHEYFHAKKKGLAGTRIQDILLRRQTIYPTDIQARYHQKIHTSFMELTKITNKILFLQSK